MPRPKPFGVPDVSTLAPGRGVGSARKSAQDSKNRIFPPDLKIAPWTCSSRILVNNLGIFEPKAFDDIPDAEWLRFFDVNVVSGVRLARLYLPSMRTRNWGRIIFISSESGVQIPAEMIHYGVTKTAQLAVSRGLAESLAGTGITVNSVLPGPTKSRGVGDFVDALARDAGKSFEEFEREFFAKVRPTSLIKRFATPEEVANMVAYVASPLSSATTGSSLRVDGGTVKSAF